MTHQQVGTRRADAGEILIVGAGSVGRRHLANLQALGWPRLRLCRTGRATLPDLVLAHVPTDRDLCSALARCPVGVVVANPSALHVPVALEAAQAGAHLLIEKPLSHDLVLVDQLEREVASRGLVAMMGFQFRFSPGLLRIRDWIRCGAIGEVVSVQVHWGEFLPDMHPWEDYRQGYAARSVLGGGVLNTLCHPFDYLRWLVGDVRCARATESRRNPLGLSVDTCVDVALEFVGGATGHVHLNFVQRLREHRLTVIGTDGTAGWSDADHAAWRCTEATTGVERVAAPAGFDRNSMFLDEISHFLTCIADGGEPACTLQDGRAALETVLGARRSMRRTAVALATHELD